MVDTDPILTMCLRPAFTIEGSTHRAKYSEPFRLTSVAMAAMAAMAAAAAAVETEAKE